MKQIILSLLLLFSSMLGYARQADDSKTKSGNMSTEKKCLVAFFSRADENYAVGYIEKGNTHIVAEMIAAAKNKIAFWKDREGDFMMSDAYIRAASVIVRSYERIYYHLNALEED